MQVSPTLASDLATADQKSAADVPDVQHGPNSQTQSSVESSPDAASDIPRGSLRRNIQWIFLGNISVQAAQYLLVSMLTHSGEKGEANPFFLGSWIAMSVVMFTDLGLRSVQATDSKREFEFGDYLGLRLLTSLAATVIILGYAYWRFHSGAEAPLEALAIGVVGLVRVLESIADLFHARLQLHEHMAPIAVSLMGRGVAGLIAGGAAYLVFRNVFALAVGLAAVRLLLLFLVDAPQATVKLSHRVRGLELRERLAPRWRLPTLRKLFIAAFPLGIAVALVTWNACIPRIMCDRLNDEGLLEAFGAMTNLIAAGTIVVSAVGSAASPRLARYYADANRAAFFSLLKKLIVLGVGLGAAGVLVAWLGGEVLLRVAFGPRVAEHYSVFPLIMAGGATGFVGSLLGYALTATRGFNRYIRPYAAATASTAFFSWLLIRPSLGLTGAAAVLVVSGLGTCAAAISMIFTDPNLRPAVNG